MGSSDEWRLEVLGPLVLRRGARVIKVGRPQVRSVLRLLGLHGARGCSTDEMVEHLWPRQAPRNPENSINVALTRTRSALGEGRDLLVNDAGHFRLAVSTDTAEFEGLAETSEQTLAIRALELWRAPLPFENSPVADTAMRALQIIRRRLALGVATSAIEAGDAATAVAALEPLNSSADDEETAVLQAHAFSLTGRRNEALRVLHRTQQVLRDSGLEPGTDFSRVEQAILAGPTVESIIPAAGRRRLPPGGLHGRTQVVADLLESKSGFDVIVGEAGIGKSAVLDEVEQRLSEQGTTVVRASANAMPERPMELFATCLASVAAPRSHNDLSSAALGAIRQLAPELGIGSAGASVPDSREELVDMTVQAVSELAPSHSHVLLLDDLHWIDRASAAVLQRLADVSPTRIIGACRPELPGHAEYLYDSGLNHRVVALDPMGLPAATQLIRERLGPITSEPFEVELCNRSGRNPLYLSLLLDSMREGQSLEQLPATVLEVAQGRTARLSADAQALLQAASVSTNGISLDLAKRLVPQAESLFAEAERAGIVDWQPNAGSYHFRHALIRDAIYQLLPEGRRVVLHDEYGRLLEDSGASSTEVAIHAHRGASLDQRRAVALCLRAANEYAIAFALDETEQWTKRGLEHLEQLGGKQHAHEAELLLNLGFCQLQTMDPECFSTGLRALRVAQKTDDLGLRARITAALSVPGQLWEGDSTANSGPEELRRTGSAVLEELRWLLDAELDPTDRARLALAAQLITRFSVHDAWGTSHYRDALRVLDLVDDPAVERALLLELPALSHPRDRPEMMETAKRLDSIAGSHPRLNAALALTRFGLALISNDTAAAEEALLASRRLELAANSRWGSLMRLTQESVWCRYTGDLEQCEALAGRALEIGLSTANPLASVVNYTGCLASVREAQGRLGELYPEAKNMLAMDPQVSTWQAYVTMTSAAAGDLERARQDLARYRQQRWTILDSFDQSWSAIVGGLLEAARTVEDEAAVQRLEAELRPYADMIAWNGIYTHRLISEYLR